MNTLDLMVMSSSILSNYDTLDQTTLDLLNPSKNKISEIIMNKYPDVNIKVMNSVSLSFTLYTLWLCKQEQYRIQDNEVD